jgi:hypothetical protein
VIDQFDTFAVFTHATFKPMPKMSLFGKITRVYIQIDSTVKQMEHFILSTTHVVSDG